MKKKTTKRSSDRLDAFAKAMVAEAHSRYQAAFAQTIKIAKELVGDPADYRPRSCMEYVRGQCELIADLFPVEGVYTTDRAREIARLLSIKHDIYASLVHSG